MKREYKELIVTMRFVDDEGNVVYKSLEEAHEKMSEWEFNKLTARMLTAATGRKHVPVKPKRPT